MPSLLLNRQLAFSGKTLPLRKYMKVKRHALWPISSKSILTSTEWSTPCRFMSQRRLFQTKKASHARSSKSVQVSITNHKPPSSSRCSSSSERTNLFLPPQPSRLLLTREQLQLINTIKKNTRSSSISITQRKVVSEAIET